MSVCLWNSWNCLFDQWNSENPVIEMTHLAFQIIQTQASWKIEFMRIFGEFGGDSIWSFYDRCLCLRTTLLGNPRPYKFSPWENFWIPATNCPPRNARCSISIRNSETKQALKNIIKLDRAYSTRIPKPNRPQKYRYYYCICWLWLPNLAIWLNDQVIWLSSSKRRKRKEKKNNNLIICFPSLYAFH